MPRLTATERPGAVRYSRLANPGQDIRLLEILPVPSPEDALAGRLVPVCLDHKKMCADFYALSSLLGDSDATETIYVDGKAVRHSAHQTAGLKTMRNLFYAGQQQKRQPHAWPLTAQASAAPGYKLKLPHRLRKLLGIHQACLYVWLDALCVNGDDADETAQLRDTMKRVYRAATTVAGWLGPAIAQTAEGVGILAAIDKAMPAAWGDPGDKERHPEDYAPTHKWFAALAFMWEPAADGTAAFLLPHWVGANDFMQRPYFQRQWILQELFMARNPAFMIGEYTVSWKAILRVTRTIEEFKDNESDMFPSDLRPAIAELPLGTVYELLEEIMRRKQRLRSIPNLQGAESSGIFPYFEYDETTVPASNEVLKKQSEV